MMFPEEIRIEKESDIPFGTTKVDYYRSEMELRKILERFKCQKILIAQDGDKKSIAFELNGKSYVFRVPKVYIKRGKGYHRQFVYEEHIGIRIVYQVLKAIVPYTDSKMVFGEQILLSARLIWNKQGQMVPISDHMDEIIGKAGYEGTIPAFSSAKKVEGER